MTVPDKRLHVLIVGISEYPRLPGDTDPMPPSAFGMRKLASPALSAFRLHKWLVEADKKEELPLRLGYVSLHLSPSQAEIAADADLAAARAAGNHYKPCSLACLQQAASEWRDAAKVDRDGMTWFYFGGHGVQRSKNDAVLLLEEFGQPFGGALQHAIDVNTLFNGMAPTDVRPDIARAQVYFIDACRMRPEEFQKIESQNPSQVFQVELSGQDDRRAPIFFATVSGAMATGFRGRPSLFAQVLLQCLEGSAGRLVDDGQGGERWMVTSQCAQEAMRVLLDDWRELGGQDQTFTIGGLTPQDVPLRKLVGPPNVDIVIDVNPDLARALAQIIVTEAANLQVMPLAPPGPPFYVRWPAGIYRFQVQAPPPYANFGPVPRQLMPPRGKLIGKVGP